MEEKTINLQHLKKELALKKFQFSSIYEFSESIYSSFQVENIIRIYFSTMMGQLGISRIFFFDSENKLFQKRGFLADQEDIKSFRKEIKKLGHQWFYMTIDQLPEELAFVKSFLESKKIHSIVNISDSEKRMSILGLGAKFNKKELTTENIEYAFFVSKFSLSAIENAIMINKLIESKRMEHELQIARDIQLSLLPQSLPQMKNVEVGVIYEPINEVGGDYYDILKDRNGQLPILIADVEGKGLSAALLAASSQAIFRSLNELNLIEPCKFVSKANSLITEFTKGKRFITVFWMLVDDKNKTLTYVNAGHIEPLLISMSKNTVTRLSTGGFITGFINEAEYEKETIQLESGDFILAFTDGVPEVENKAGEEFGLDAMIQFVKDNRHLSAKELTESLFNATKQFSQGKKFRDDFTLITLKVM